MGYFFLKDLILKNPNNVGNTDFQKQANQALILDYLRRNGSVSRVDLARTIGLRQSTVTYIINRLGSSNIVRESGSGRQIEKRPKGRNPIPISLNTSYAYILGLDIGKQECRMAITDIVGAVQYQEKLTAPRKGGAFADLVMDYYSRGMQKADSLGFRILALGISLPGIVDTRKGIVTADLVHDLKDYPLADLLKKKISLPILIDRDSNCCGQGMLWRDMKDARDPSFVYVLFRNHRDIGKAKTPQNITNPALALVINGSVYRGMGNAAGEFFNINSAGLEKKQSPFSYIDTAKAFEDSSAKQKAVNDLFGRLSMVCLNLMPETVYVGGDLFFDEPWFRKHVNTKMNIISQYPQLGDCKLVFPEDSSYDPAYGACANVLAEIFTIPQVGKQSGTEDLSWERILKI